MHIKATFTGKDSLGYKNGEEYDLLVVNSNYIAIKRIDGSGGCNYNTFVLFLNNWNKIRVIK